MHLCLRSYKRNKKKYLKGMLCLTVETMDLPIKSKFGCVIFEPLELHGWHTIGSTASVSFTLSVE